MRHIIRPSFTCHLASTDHDPCGHVRVKRFEPASAFVVVPPRRSRGRCLEWTRRCRNGLHPRTSLDMTTRLHPRHNSATCDYLRHVRHLRHCTPGFTTQARESSLCDEQVLCHGHVPVRHAMGTCVTSLSLTSVGKGLRVSMPGVYASFPPKLISLSRTSAVKPVNLNRRDNETYIVDSNQVTPRRDS